MSLKDKIKIAELEAKLHVYEVALGNAGLGILKIPKKERRSEMGFVPRRKREKK